MNLALLKVLGLCELPHRKSEQRARSLAPERGALPCHTQKGVQTMEQLVIAYKKLREAARLLAAEPLAGYEDSVWTRAVVGLALAGIAIWAGFVVS